MSERASQAVEINGECGCVNCRIGRYVKAAEHERDEALALAFERGRALAAAIAARDEARRDVELLKAELDLARGEAMRLASERERLRRTIAESAAPPKPPRVRLVIVTVEF